MRISLLTLGIVAVVSMVTTPPVGATGRITWGGDVDRQWTSESNWGCGPLPTSSDAVRIVTPSTGRSPVIDGYQEVGYAGTINIAYGGHGRLDISHSATLNVNNGAGDVYLGNSLCDGAIYINDGYIWCDDVYVGWDGGGGLIDIKSGGIYCDELSSMDKVNVHGFAAFIQCSTLSFSGSGMVDIEDGMLILAGDQTSNVAEWIAGSRITGSGGTVLYDYNHTNTGATTIYATKKTVSSELSYSGQYDLVIEDKFIRHFDGDGIYLYDCDNVIIRNCEFVGCGMDNELGYRGVYALNGGNVSVENCKFKNCRRGVWITSTDNNAKISRCWFYNTKGAHLFTVTGAGNCILDNRFQSSSIEGDTINVYGSYGTSESNILIQGNEIKNHWTAGHHGNGIVVLDTYGQYILCQWNRITNDGTSICGGYDIVMKENTVYADPSGCKDCWCGIAVWDYNDRGCDRVAVQGNDVNFTGNNGKACQYHVASPNDCGVITGWDDNNCEYSGNPDTIWSDDDGNIFN